MPRPRKIDTNEPRMADVTPLEVESTNAGADEAPQFVKAPNFTPAEPVKKLKIADNPYLDETEKELLVKAKLNWFIDKLKRSPSENTIISFTQDGKQYWVKVGVSSEAVQDAWAFCKDNTKMTKLEFVNTWLKGVLGERGVVFFPADHLELQ